jgi:hypothetical protein
MYKRGSFSPTSIHIYIPQSAIVVAITNVTTPSSQENFLNRK